MLIVQNMVCVRDQIIETNNFGSLDSFYLGNQISFRFHLHMEGIGCVVCVIVVAIFLCWFKHILIRLTWKGTGQRKDPMSQPLPHVDNEVMLFKNILSQ